jgi:hypothetical protein
MNNVAGKHHCRYAAGDSVDHLVSPVDSAVDRSQTCCEVSRLGRLDILRVAWCVGFTLAGAAPLLAQPVTETLRLTPEEKANILNHQTEASVDAARAGPGGGGGGRQIHGEIGATIGSRGLRDFYGTAAIPLGDHAAAAVSFEDGRYTPHR